MNRRNNLMKVHAEAIGESETGKSVLFSLTCGRKFWLSWSYLDAYEDDGQDDTPKHERSWSYYCPRYILKQKHLLH